MLFVRHQILPLCPISEPSQHHNPLGSTGSYARNDLEQVNQVSREEGLIYYENTLV